MPAPDNRRAPILNRLDKRRRRAQSPSDAGACQLHAAPVDVLVVAQPREQLAFAAAQIEDARPRLNQFADDRVIAAAKNFQSEFIRDAGRSRAACSPRMVYDLRRSRRRRHAGPRPRL